MEEEKNELEESQKKCEEYLNGWKRSQADFINYKKDEIRRFEEVLKFGNEILIRDLLIVLDTFDRALDHSAALGEPRLRREQYEESQDASAKPQHDISIIRNQFTDILKKNGLEEVLIKVGDQFDPKFHEAITEVENGQASGAIVEILEMGYNLHGKLIRPAKVKVSK